MQHWRTFGVLPVACPYLAKRFYSGRRDYPDRHDGRMWRRPRTGSSDHKPIPEFDTPPINNKPASAVVFPQHDAPLETDRGGEYFAAQLILREGCIRAEVSPSHDANDPGSWLLIWPNGFTLEAEPGTVRVVGELGQVVARVGDHIRVSRAPSPLSRLRSGSW